MYIIRQEFTPIIDNLPPSLQTLIIVACLYHRLDNLPLTLQRLTVISKYKDYPFSIDNLPSRLTHLHIELHSLDCLLDHLPSSLIVLNLSIYLYNLPFFHLPLTIKKSELK